MEPVSRVDWHRMLGGSEPPLYLPEIVFRVATIYIVAVLAVRRLGKRGNRNLSPFENVVSISLGSAAGETMFYPKVPLVYAFLVVAGVVALNRVFALAQRKVKAFNTLLEGDPLMVNREAGPSASSAIQNRRNARWRARSPRMYTTITLTLPTE